MKVITREELEKVFALVEGSRDYERTIGEDVKAGNREGHEIGMKSADYRIGFADGIDQAIFMIREFLA